MQGNRGGGLALHGAQGVEGDRAKTHCHSLREESDMSSGGGGGQSGITRYDWNPVMQAYYAGTPEAPGGWLQVASQEAWKPYEGYTGQQVAGLAPYQTQAMQGIYHSIYGGGLPEVTAAKGAALDFASGNNTNQFGGLNNPYYQDLVQQGMGDITDAYRQGTAADTTRMFNLAGAFGGSAHQQAVENNENALAKQLGNYANQMYSQQYDRAGSLASEDLNRQLQSIPLGYQGQNATFDQFRQLMGAGDLRRNYNQQQLDAAYKQWAERQNYGRNAVDWMMNVLGRAQGSTGVSTNTPAYGGINPMAGLLGAGALYGGMGGFG